VPEFESDGVRLHYVLAGPAGGLPTVLVHGFASDYDLNWVGSRWQQTLTEAGRRVIGLDCRGHGRSQKPHDPAAYERGAMAGDVLRLLDHVGIPRADYVGYSMGARIGLQVVVERPQRIRRAVLGGLGMVGTFDHASAIARRLKGEEGPGQDPVADTFYAFASAGSGNDLEALAACMLAPPPRIDERQLQDIEVPLLLVVGDQDDIATGADALARRIPAAQLVVLPGRNHMSAVPARPFKEAALAFLEG